MLAAWGGSLRLTLYLLPLLLFGVSFYYLQWVHSDWVVAFPLLLLALNLLLAIVSHPTFRCNVPLLSFHLALLAIVVLVALGRVSYLRGELELATGEGMPMELARYHAGVFHEQRVSESRFALRGIDVQFNAEGRRQRTAAQVSWQTARGHIREATVSDMEPLRLGGYRFYTTRQFGFAPLFAWQPHSGEQALVGAIHMPAYVTHEHGQALEWSLPGKEHKFWTALELDEAIIKAGQESVFHLPTAHTLVIREGEQRYELHPGGAVELADGTLTYREMRSWMGFAVFYDWTLTWLLASGVVAVLSLGWHYWRKFAAKPWLHEETN